MKKLLSLLIAIFLCLALPLSLAGCDEEGFDFKEIIGGLLEELSGTNPFAAVPTVVENAATQWTKALTVSSFDNVTLRMQMTMGETEESVIGPALPAMKTDQIFKISGDRVYREATSTDLEGNPLPDYTVQQTYSGSEAAAQRALVFNTVLAVLADYENYVYDEEAGVYRTENAVEARIEDTVEFNMPGVSSYTIERMENGEVKIENGRLIYFSGMLTESIYFVSADGSQEMLAFTQEMETVWELVDYGTTVID